MGAKCFEEAQVTFNASPSEGNHRIPEQRTKKEERKNRYSQELAKFFTEKGFEVKLESKDLTIRRGLEKALVTLVHNPNVRKRDIIGFTVPRFQSTVWFLVKEFRAKWSEKALESQTEGTLVPSLKQMRYRGSPRPDEFHEEKKAGLELGELTARIGLSLYMIAAGLWEPIASKPEKTFTVEELADSDPTGLKKRLLKAATDAGLLRKREKGFTASVALIDLLEEMPFSDWLFRACGNFLTHLKEFLEAPTVARKVYHRNGELVAEASVKIGELTYYRAVKDAVMMLNPPPKKILDIGAGTANLLCSIIKTIPTARGTALDMDPDACAAARATVIRHGLADRIRVIQERAETAVQNTTEVAEADVVILCFLLHEILAQGREHVTSFLQGIASILSSRGSLIVVDEALDEKNPPFAASFAWIHDLQGQRLPSDSEWRDIFKKAGLQVVKTSLALMPGSRLYQLRRDDYE